MILEFEHVHIARYCDALMFILDNLISDMTSFRDCLSR
jgi:hypothetical protein